jgi:hypothetical protein
MASPAHQDRWIREEAMAATAFDTAPNLSRRQLRARSAVAAGQHSECPGIVPTVETAAVAAPFQPLNSGIVSDGDPAIFHRSQQGRLLGCPGCEGEVRGSFPVRELRPVLCKKEQPAGGIRDDTSVRAVRA